MQAVKMIGIIVIIVGIIVAGTSLLADAIGIGSKDNVFGYKQLIGLVLGIAGVTVGVVLLVRG
jgi:hypothetical protein